MYRDRLKTRWIAAHDGPRDCLLKPLGWGSGRAPRGPWVARPVWFPTPKARVRWPARVFQNADYANWFRVPPFVEMVMDRSASVGDLFSPDLVESVLRSGNIRQSSSITSLAVFAAVGGT